MADGELVPVRFDIRTPGTPEIVLAQMAASKARALPPAIVPYPVTIVANGPSAADPELWADIQDKCVVALNGALSLFVARGLVPNYWCACDPQPRVADFLPEDPPRRTIYLVASKCHPSVFEKLSGRMVRVWDVDDYPNDALIQVPTAVSVTLTTIGLLRLMGFNQFDVWGWDCCYLGGAHHAGEGEPPADHSTAEVRSATGVEVFETSGSWMAELDDAIVMAYNLKAIGYGLKVRGPGIVRAALEAKHLCSR